MRTHRGSRAVTGARPFHSHDASPSPDNNSTIPTTRRTTVALRRRKKKLARERMQQVLTALCREQFMTLNVLARLVEREAILVR